MVFRSAHKLTSYLMVTCAFLALALSGQMSEISVVLGALGIAVSWLWETPRVRPERWQRLWTVLSILVLIYSVLAVLAGTDLLLVGSTFLTYLLIAKLFNRVGASDYQQIYVLSFLMLVAGTVLNAQITYGLLFVGYVVTATWALTIFHLRREVETRCDAGHPASQSGSGNPLRGVLSSRRIVGGRFFLATSLVSVSIFVCSSLLFLAVPRIGFGLFFDKRRGGLSMAGFSDGVQLGGHGTIKHDSTVVMRVHVDEAYQGRGAPYVHWRGVAFDRYERGEWHRSLSAPETERHVTMNRERRTTINHLLYDRPLPAPGQLAARMQRSLRQEIYLEPLGYDVLFGASMPLAFEFETQVRERARGERNDEIRHPHTAGMKYVVYSDPIPPPPEQLRRARGPLPPDFEAYLELPPEVTSRTYQLAAEITRGLDNNYDRVVALEQWLKENLRYSLVMESPGDSEPIDFFLFDRGAGHCEYFASALAIMARTIAIPTRNVNGFLGGEWNEYDDYIAVRAGDAHSWVEAYFPGQGWVTFDPTPAGEVDRLGRGDGGWLDKLGRFADTIKFKWFKWVIEYDLYRQMRLFRGLGRALRGGADKFLSGGLGGLKSWAKANLATAAAVIISLLAVVVAFLFFKRRRHSGARERRRRRSAISGHYLAVLRRLARRGHRRAPGDTPREFAATLARDRVAGAGALIELTELYYREEYGPGTPDAAQRARDLYRAIVKAPR